MIQEQLSQVVMPTRGIIFMVESLVKIMNIYCK